MFAARHRQAGVSDEIDRERAGGDLGRAEADVDRGPSYLLYMAVDLDDERAADLVGEPQAERVSLRFVDRAVVIGVEAAALGGARNFAEEHGIGDPDAVAERGQLEVAVVVIDRGRDVGRKDRERQHAE